MDLRAEVVIDAPAHAAWVVLGERFGQISDWAAPIETSSLEGQPAVGAIRACQFVGFGPFKSGTVKERLVEFDPPDNVACLRECRRHAKFRQTRDQPLDSSSADGRKLFGA